MHAKCNGCVFPNGEKQEFNRDFIEAVTERSGGWGWVMPGVERQEKKEKNFYLFLKSLFVVWEGGNRKGQRILLMEKVR